MKNIMLMALCLFSIVPAFAQSNTAATVNNVANAVTNVTNAVNGNPNNTNPNVPQEVIVKIQQQQLPPPPAPQTVPEKLSEYVKFGKDLGSAFDAGLSSLSTHAEQFSKTDAGRFTMAVIAWKVAGRDILDTSGALIKQFKVIILGTAFLIAWNTLAIWFYRRMFLPRRVVIEVSGNFWNRTKKYQTVNEDRSWQEGRTIGATVTALVWIGVNLALVFGVILT
jgi:hypothetical protein